MMFYQIPTKLRTDEIVVTLAVTDRMVETIDLFKTGPSEIKSHIAITRPLDMVETLKVTLTRGTAVPVTQDFVAQHHQLQPTTSIDATTFKHLLTTSVLVPLEVAFLLVVVFVQLETDCCTEVTSEVV